MAPNIEQAVVNHLSGEEEAGATRNVLEESARIARGNISDIAKVTAADIDALIFPGGFGAAKSLCNFASKGPDCEVNPEVARLVREIVAAKKPLAAICIAPALISKVLGDDGLTHKLTIGTDEGTAGALKTMGSEHVDCPATDFVIDSENKLVSSPGYMLAGSIKDVAEGVEKTVREVLKMI
jgi:enhancing lycopene biosynthesis protein 2